SSDVCSSDLVSELTRKYIREHKDQWLFISTACPSVTRLIQIRFLNLIKHLLPIIAPIDLAAHLAKEKAIKETGLPANEIGIIFISPCPAKISAIQSPIGMEKSEIDVALSMKDIYPKLLSKMNKIINQLEL